MRSDASAPAAPRGTVDRRRRRLLAGIASGAGVASALAGCGGSGLTEDATLRAVNATMDVTSIDVQVNDWLFAGAVAYGEAASSYERRNSWALGPLGAFEVRRAGTASMLLRDTQTLPDGDAASVVVMGNLAAGLGLRVIDEATTRPVETATRLRLLHAWPLAGAVDAFVTRGNDSLVGRTPTVRLAAYGELSTFADVSGDDRLRITPAGRTDVLLFDSASIGLAARQVATLVVSPAPGTARVAVAVLPQAQPAYVLANAAVAAGPSESS